MKVLLISFIERGDFFPFGDINQETTQPHAETTTPMCTFSHFL